MMTAGSPGRTETALQAGDISCPDCSDRLRPHGFARTRTVRGLGDDQLTLRPRRDRCAGCGLTQVLPAVPPARRADAL